MKYNYQFDCRDPLIPTEEMIKAVDEATEITWETFRRNINLDDLKALMPGLYSWTGRGLHIKNDPCVSFWKTKMRGFVCYFISWSSIEFFFTTRRIYGKGKRISKV